MYVVLGLIARYSLIDAHHLVTNHSSTSPYIGGIQQPTYPPLLLVAQAQYTKIDKSNRWGSTAISPGSVSHTARRAEGREKAKSSLLEAQDGASAPLLHGVLVKVMRTGYVAAILACSVLIVISMGRQQGHWEFMPVPERYCLRGRI